MSAYEVKDAVWTRLNALWTTTRVVDFENKRSTISDNLTPWVSPHFVGGAERQIGMGDGPDARYWREEGVVHFLVAVPAMTGWRDCDTYARQLSILFRGVQVTADIVFGAVSPPQIYSRDEQITGNWYIKAVLARYERTYTDPT